MLKNEWLMASLLALATLTAALLLLRWLAPNLIGAPVDLRLVQTAQEVPPFYRNVFRNEDVDSDQFILNDPETVARAKPLYPDLDAMGPNDILGFRNRDVPNVADIVTIGDSQTYGNNAPLEQNWPSQLETLLGAERRLRVYNMSVGAWGALNYLAVLEYALRLQPRIVIVAFYTGNDPLTDFTGAYGNPAWERFRVDSTLTAADAPSVVFPPPLHEHLGVRFSDGSSVVFTPDYRFGSNDRDDPAVRAGYGVMAAAAAEMRDAIVAAGALAVFTIIPTKEWVYAARVEADAPEHANARYRVLVRDETRNIEELAAALATLEGARYVDVTRGLRDAASGGVASLYPGSSDGHPLAAGYAQIAAALAPALAAALPPPLSGVYGISGRHGGVARAYVITRRGKWILPNADMALANGWGEGGTVKLAPIAWRDLITIPTLGVVDEVDPSRFGPAAEREP